ncbi:MAG: hypothetical protein ACLRZG_03010 [Streptococcus sp.]
MAPGAQVGGPIAYLHTGDLVTVDQDTKEIIRTSQTKSWRNARQKQPCHRTV